VLLLKCLYLHPVSKHHFDFFITPSANEDRFSKHFHRHIQTQVESLYTNYVANLKIQNNHISKTSFFLFSSMFLSQMLICFAVKMSANLP